MPFKYSAQYIENVSYNKYSTKYGTASCFFQDHHTILSYNFILFIFVRTRLFGAQIL